VTLVPGIYQHHKGGKYAALFTGFDADSKADDARRVVYLSLSTGEWYTRPIAEFKSPRFRLVHQFLPVELDLLGQLREQFYQPA
jgi:hypothetical protein